MVVLRIVVLLLGLYDFEVDLMDEEVNYCKVVCL